MKRFILSPCGTSLLTNQAGKNDRKLVFKYANEKHKEDIPLPERKRLKALIDRAQKSLFQDDNYERASKMSAELNGIIKIYGGKIDSKSDFHLLLSTDTWLGEETARIVRKWLEQHGLCVDVHRQVDLQTKDIEAFQIALSDLVKKLSDEIPSYSQKGYTIIFNLTGGFKSVQGFLQSISNFYADETVYIFETSSELLRIPKLPVRMDAKSVIQDQLDVFRKLALGIPVPATALKDIPETLLLKINGTISLSPWGELMWEQYKQEIYGEGLLPPPVNRIRYSDSFKKSVQDLPVDRMLLINRRIDRLAQYVLTGHNPKSLDFKQIKGKAALPSTHEINAWSDKDARRIFGHFENDVFVLDRLDKGLH